MKTIKEFQLDPLQGQWPNYFCLLLGAYNVWSRFAPMTNGSTMTYLFPKSKRLLVEKLFNALATSINEWKPSKQIVKIYRTLVIENLSHENHICTQ